MNYLTHLTDLTYIAGFVAALTLIMSTHLMEYLKAALMYPATCTSSGYSTDRTASARTSDGGLMERSATSSEYLASPPPNSITTKKELEVPGEIYDNRCMINKMKYAQLLDLQWAIKSNILRAQTKYDEYYQKYGKKDKNDLLTELAYDDLKLLRDAKKTVEQVIKVMKANELYTYSN